MTLLFNEEVEIIVGNKTLITPSPLQIHTGFKYCIIGQNGAGKTTLMNYIYDKIRKTNTLYVKQADKAEDNCTIYKYMLQANKDLYDIYIRYIELEISMNEEHIEVTDEIFEEYKKCSEILKNEQFNKYNAKIKQILNGLGIKNHDKQVKSLSGGQEAKLTLAKTLLLEPEILLLDEPTNHLDLDNVLWLRRYLNEYKKTLILISHNIDFFDNIANKIIYFFCVDPQNPRVFICDGGYCNFLKIYERKKNEYIDEYEKSLKQVKSLEKQLGKKSTLENQEKYSDAKKNVKLCPLREETTVISFNNVKYLSSSEYSNVISFDNVNFGYDDSPLLLKNITLGVSMKNKYILIGDNGSGKSTFFKLCKGVLKPKSGTITKDERLCIGYFNQNTIREMDESFTPVQYLNSIKKIQDDNDYMLYRKILAEVGFKKTYVGDRFDVEKLTIAELSGGQRVKLALCGIKILNPHVILFDEPTNHLDIYSIEEFINAINEYNGGVIIITHDKYIIENIDGYELLMLNNNTITKYNGTFDDYCEELEKIILT